MADTKQILTINDRGADVAALHKSLAKLAYAIPANEADAQLFGVGTQAALRQFQTKHRLRRSGALDERTRAALQRAVGVVDSGKNRIEGRIYFDEGRLARDVKLAFYRRGFGGTEARIGEATTDEEGFYACTFDPQAYLQNVEVRCEDAEGNEIALSETKYDLDRHAVLNLVAPGTIGALAPEYERLTAAVAKEIGSLPKLAEARETADRRDLTLLHKATGWDARLLALAATAVKLGAETKLPTDFLYALFRVGLPTDKDLLCTIREQALDKAIAKATEAGIVDMDAKHLLSAKRAFKRFAEKTRRDIRAPGAPSTVGEMLAKSGLTAAEAKTFEALYFAHRGPARELWQKAEQQGIAKASIDKLRLQGKLAVLTYNNLALVEPLQAEVGTPDALDRLVDLDLDRAETWQARIREIAGEDDAALARAIPLTYVGKSTEERLGRYASDLARKVRLSFPTQVIRRLIERDELSLGGAEAAVKGSVATFLRNATRLGFRLGSVSVPGFVARQGEQLFQDIDPRHTDAVVAEVRRLHRLYQITPGDGSLKVLDELGFSSADEVVQLSVEEFCDQYGKQFPSPKEAELIWRKSQQVSAVTFNWVTTALHINSVPGFYAISGTESQRAEAKSHLGRRLKDYPTMESLFGSLDFCECEHCRSVLSPAAYLVDLFQFLDPDDTQWEHKCQFWSERHNGSTYGYPRPFEVLRRRRPDLEHLTLDCENTNTAPPYIDVVNEILEYAVAYGDLSPEACHDTGEATTEELLAEPHHILPAAYGKLRDPDEACHPLTLPFDLWLETVRGYLSHFDLSLWQMLEAFGTSEELFSSSYRPYADSGYFRAAVFVEYLGLSPDEYRVFTRERPTDWRRLYGDVEGGVLAALKSAGTLARRLDVSYRELVDIVQTGFVNPELDKLAVLWKYGFGPSDALRYLEHRDDPEYLAETQGFEERIKTRLAQTLADHEVVDAQVGNILRYIEERRSDGTFERTLVLRDQSGLCNFDQTYLEYAEPALSTPSPLDFVKINLFVRLWKKLGWTIEDIDRALQVFLPGGSEEITDANIDEAFRTALLYLAHLKALDEQIGAGRDSRLKLLTLWSDLPTTGSNPLYARLFLTPSVQKIDPVFDDTLGNYLSVLDIALEDHLFGLQAALQLTADEVGLILADAGMGLKTAALNLANCSLLHRYRLLANALTLSVGDLIRLKALSGRDPFRALSPGPLEELADDFPWTETLRFVGIAQRIQESGFRVEDLDYLLAHRFDPVGRYRDDPTALLALLKTLGTELNRIREAHAVPPDPAALSDDQLRQKLALVLPAEVADQFMAMWAGTVEYQAVLPDVPPDNQLSPDLFTNLPDIRVSYDPVNEAQRLVFRGVLLHDQRVLLEGSLSWIDSDSFWSATVDGSTRFRRLLDSVQQQAQDFFEHNLLKTDLDDRHSFGFLEEEDFELLFSPGGDDDDDKEKRKRLAQTFLPYLQRQLARQTIVQTLAANLTAEPASAERLLTDTRLLSDPTQPGDPQPLLNAFAAAAERGVTATYRVDGDSHDRTVLLPTAATLIPDPVTEEPLPLSRARFEGYLEVPATGAYRFYLRCERADVRAVLRFAHLTDPILPQATPAEEVPALELKSEVVELQAGVPYAFSCLVRNLGGSGAELLVQGESLAKGTLSRLTLYPQATVDRLTHAQTLLAKVWQIVQGFALTERELVYLLTHPDDFGGLDLSALPTVPPEASSIEPTGLFDQFMRLADYARLREDLAAGEGLIDLFEHSRRAYDDDADEDLNEQIASMDQGLCQTLADITRRELKTVQDAAAHLGYGTVAVPDAVNPAQLVAAAFTNEKGIQRLWEILRIVERLGVSVGDAAGWATPGPDVATARDLKHTLKVRYEQENWLRIARPIHDRLRRKQRDALVAFLMHRDGFESVERLYEHFVVDPGMEPVVQTSRIQLAIASVQTFIQRCLLNLEPDVAPSMIDAQQWQWMKEYRLWEVNRKIFLFPENWLEPEWREDKTHLFRELESALLQGDVSRELVEDAFHSYLKGLEKIARLDIVTMYREQDPDDPTAYTLHVIGRTFELSPSYYYRRYSNRMWTPWEPVGVNIQGDHVVAVVWRKRLHLFWVTFIPGTATHEAEQNENYQDRAEAPIADTMPNTELQIQLNWCEHFQGKWQTPGSGDLTAAISATVLGTFDKSKESRIFIHATKEYAEGEERAILIHLCSDDFLRPWGVYYGPNVLTAFHLANSNSSPRTRIRDLPKRIPYESESKTAARYHSKTPFQITFEEDLITVDGQPFQVTLPTREILDASEEQEDGFSLLLSSNLSDSTFSKAERILSEYFYQDDLNTLFVEPVLEVTDLNQAEGFGIDLGTPGPYLEADRFWNELPVFSANAEEPPRPPESAEPVLIDPSARYSFVARSDWATDPSSAIAYDGSLIGHSGSMGAAGSRDGQTTTGDALVATQPAPTNIARHESLFAIRGLNVVGGTGMNRGIIANLRARSPGRGTR